MSDRLANRPEYPNALEYAKRVYQDIGLYDQTITRTDRGFIGLKLEQLAEIPSRIAFIDLAENLQKIDPGVRDMLTRDTLYEKTNDRPSFAFDLTYRRYPTGDMMNPKYEAVSASPALRMAILHETGLLEEGERFVDMFNTAKVVSQTKEQVVAVNGDRALTHSGETGGGLISLRLERQLPNLLGDDVSVMADLGRVVTPFLGSYALTEAPGNIRVYLKFANHEAIRRCGQGSEAIAEAKKRIAEQEERFRQAEANNFGRGSRSKGRTLDPRTWFGR